MKELSNSFKILFVCGRNKWRSPTATAILRHYKELSVKSAGLSPKSRHQINEKDINWADLIIVMETSYKARILGTFRDLDLPPIEDLNIPDEYEFMNEELIDEIKKSMKFVFKKYQIDIDFST